MDKSHKVRLIEEYYAALGRKLIWDSYKVRKMCEAVGIELEELAATMRITDKMLALRLRKGFSKPESLLLYHIAVSRGYYTPLP